MALPGAISSQGSHRQCSRVAPSSNPWSAAHLPAVFTAHHCMDGGVGHMHCVGDQFPSYFIGKTLRSTLNTRMPLYGEHEHRLPWDGLLGWSKYQLRYTHISVSSDNTLPHHCVSLIQPLRAPFLLPSGMSLVQFKGLKIVSRMDPVFCGDGRRDCPPHDAVVDRAGVS